MINLKESFNLLELNFNTRKMFSAFLLGIFLGGVSFTAADSVTILPHRIVLRDNTYEIFYDYDNETITIEAQVKTLGYVGFGLSPSGGMKGADIVIGWVEDGQAYFKDRHSTRNAMPQIDEQQDWELLSGSENDTHTILRFTRSLTNCDPDDLDMNDQTTRIIWAYSKNDPTGHDNVAYHGAENRGSFSVQLINNKAKDPAMPADAVFVNLLMQNVSVPDYLTTYWCHYFELPKFDRDHHLIMYEPVIQEGNEAHVHHIVVFGCYGHTPSGRVGKGNICAVQNMPFDKDDDDINEVFITDPVGGPMAGCLTELIVWAVGAEKFYFPKNAGMNFGPSTPIDYVRVEIHYDNPQRRKDLIDSSGIRMWLTPTLRQYNASILAVGRGVTPMHFIPYNMDSYTTRGFCAPGCLGEAMAFNPEGIKIFAAMGHTHLIGHSVKGRLFRNNTELPFLYYDKNYDFNFQEWRHFKEERTVLPTDTLLVDCEYKTTDRDSITYGGFGTNQEMCLLYFLYYPGMKLTWCTSTPTAGQILSGIGVEIGANETAVSPSEYAGKDVFQIVSELNWGDKDLVKNTETQSNTGYHYTECYYDIDTAYESSSITLKFDIENVTYLQEEKSCKEIKKGTTKPVETDTSGAIMCEVSFQILFLIAMKFIFRE